MEDKKEKEVLFHHKMMRSCLQTNMRIKIIASTVLLQIHDDSEIFLVLVLFKYCSNFSKRHLLGYSHQFTDVEYHYTALILNITIWKCSLYSFEPQLDKRPGFKLEDLKRGIGLLWRSGNWQCLDESKGLWLFLISRGRGLQYRKRNCSLIKHRRFTGIYVWFIHPFNSLTYSVKIGVGVWSDKQWSERNRWEGNQRRLKMSS